MNEIIVSILEVFLGKPKKYNEAKGRIVFDCPARY